jgi:hypothetical protein
MSAHEPSRAAAGIPLEAHVEELRSRCEAASRLQGGSTYYHEELGIFRHYADERGLLLPVAPDELSRPPDDEGNEHQVWYLPGADPERRLVVSDTHRGNIILMDDGLLAPIDLRVQPVSGSLLDTVTRLTASFPST